MSSANSVILRLSKVYPVFKQVFLYYNLYVRNLKLFFKSSQSYCLDFLLFNIDSQICVNVLFFTQYNYATHHYSMQNTITQAISIRIPLIHSISTHLIFLKCESNIPRNISEMETKMDPKWIRNWNQK